MADRKAVSVCNFYLESNQFACIAVPSCLIFKIVINLALPLDIGLDGSSKRNQKEVCLCSKNVLRVECTARAFHTNICFTHGTCVLTHGENSGDTGFISTSKPFVNHCMSSKDTPQDLIKIIEDAFLWKLCNALYQVYGCCSAQTSVSAVYFTPPVIPWGGFQDAFILRYNNKY